MLNKDKKKTSGGGGKSNFEFGSLTMWITTYQGLGLPKIQLYDLQTFKIIKTIDLSTSQSKFDFKNKRGLKIRKIFHRKDDMYILFENSQIPILKFPLLYKINDLEKHIFEKKNKILKKIILPHEVYYKPTIVQINQYRSDRFQIMDDNLQLMMLKTIFPFINDLQDKINQITQKRDIIIMKKVLSVTKSRLKSIKKEYKKYTDIEIEKNLIFYLYKNCEFFTEISKLKSKLRMFDNDLLEELEGTFNKKRKQDFNDEVGRLYRSELKRMKGMKVQIHHFLTNHGPQKIESQELKYDNIMSYYRIELLFKRKRAFRLFSQVIKTEKLTTYFKSKSFRELKSDELALNQRLKYKNRDDHFINQYCVTFPSNRERLLNEYYDTKKDRLKGYKTCKKNLLLDIIRTKKRAILGTKPFIIARNNRYFHYVRNTVDFRFIKYVSTIWDHEIVYKMKNKRNKHDLILEKRFESEKSWRIFSIELLSQKTNEKNRNMMKYIQESIEKHYEYCENLAKKDQSFIINRQIDQSYMREQSILELNILTDIFLSNFSKYMQNKNWRFQQDDEALTMIRRRGVFKESFFNILIVDLEDFEVDKLCYMLQIHKDIWVNNRDMLVRDEAIIKEYEDVKDERMLMTEISFYKYERMKTEELHLIKSGFERRLSHRIAKNGKNDEDCLDIIEIDYSERFNDFSDFVEKNNSEQKLVRNFFFTFFTFFDPIHFGRKKENLLSEKMCEKQIGWNLDLKFEINNEWREQIENFDLEKKMSLAFQNRQRKKTFKNFLKKRKNDMIDTAIAKYKAKRKIKKKVKKVVLTKSPKKKKKRKRIEIVNLGEYIEDDCDC